MSAIGWIWAAQRKPPIHSWKPSKMAMVSTPLDMDRALCVVAQQAVSANYNIEFVDQAAKAAFLSTRPDLMSWGFFYCIQFSPGQQGGSVASVGIQSRLIQGGPVVTKRLDNCANWLATALQGSRTG